MTKNGIPSLRFLFSDKLLGRMALRLSLIFISVLFFVPAFAFADSSCRSEYIDETATLQHIHDGDTLHLRGGRKVRLIGINTPELARKNKMAEPFAHAARNALERLFKNNKTLSLRYGKVKRDRYGRYLVHGFLADGQNIQAILLNQGLARVINVPPNTRFARCYLEQERHARCEKTGLWKRAQTLQAAELKNRHTGFHLVEGEVTKIHHNKKGIWLTIDQKLSLGIRNKERFLFDRQTLDSMLHQTVIVRGWVNKSKRATPFYMRVKHPLSLQLAKNFSCQ